jgi:chromosomal replication initiation ATPase DnaA
LGDDTFLEKCLAEVGEMPCQLNVQDIVTAVCRSYGIDEPSIKSPSQDRISSQARAVAGWLARELSCSTLTEVGKYVNRDIGSISSGVRRLTDRMSKTPILAAQVWSLKVGLENKLGNLEA